MESDAYKTLVTEVLESLGAEVTSIEVSIGPRVVIAVSTPHSAHLVGPGGEHLRALNHLVRRLAEQKFKDTEAVFTVDINGHLEKQLEAVRGNARMLAQRARLFKHDVELAPMSSYERLIIHELFADDPEIKTESAGEGKFRHVVLKYADKKQTAQTA